ncbi:uncharacterized protein BO97DRAFT_125848 [Aspergillus homomorphus CBS 101889]|uniref:Luciferase domain-containing protein n=1 Tax=Aspergillus homomorphus (strain CBS 101889) TaxID=1450537 RepID=A0A395HRN6_ASPHC|nr:hypothetical protein BO97DRAFT_125848 [Aspergillus homomorphus CBS 101889]RAL10430.1 hypothetical protein BO97DRAFT_125848 [Aspergillus homomorphus CBS 101889]
MTSSTLAPGHTHHYHHNHHLTFTLDPTTTTTTCLLLILLPTLYLMHTIRKDYQAFLALGPGGTPSTPAGYLRICILRLFILRNPLAAPTIPPCVQPQQGLLTPSHLPPRPGPRPTVAGIAPQRQTTQKSDAEMYETLSTEIHRLVAQHPDTLYTGTSCFEKYSTGMFCAGNGSGNSACDNTTTTTSSSSSTTTTNTITNPQKQPPAKDISPALKSSLLPSSGSPQTPQNSHSHSHQNHQRRHRLTCNGEVCHAHPSDGSLHLTLHPADVKLVVERGWGQRHPLARDSWWWWLRIVPPGFVMVYAPRDAEELECVLEIIRAAAWWVSGTELRR